MKKLFCVVLVFWVLLGTAAAYNGNTIVYVTNSGSKYHQEWCSYLKSSNAISLENAINQGYTPCSRCNPPYLDLSTSSSGGTFVRIAPDVPTPESRYAQLKREMEEQKITELETELWEKQLQLDKERARVKEVNFELKDTKEKLKQAQDDAQKAQSELEKLKRTLHLWGVCGIVIGIPVMALFIWQICWKRAKADLDRLVEAEVLKRLAAQSAEQPSFKAKPREPVASAPPPSPHPPMKERYNVGEENPYLKEAYRQRYEGKSISEMAGVPKDCGVTFDSLGYPHRKNALQADEFIVYITEKGKSYHTADCPSGTRGKAVNICVAKWKGRGPCERCKPIADLPSWVDEYQRILRICDAFDIDMLP